MHTKFSRTISRDALFKIESGLKQDFSSSTPAPFVGHVGYPVLNVGLLSLPEVNERAWEYDAPRYWAAHNKNIPHIINYRTHLINSRFKSHVKHTEKMTDLALQVGMAAAPPEVELHLAKKPTFGMHTDRILAPTGPHAQITKAVITSNPKIAPAVEKAVGDTDAKAVDTIVELYGKGFDENFLSKLLSVGGFGVKKQRKLVPTKWSITATDDMVAKKILERVHDFPEVDCQAYFGGYLGNYYLILYMPGMWGFELFEMGVPVQINPWSKSQKWYATDYEDVQGRGSYADETAGGYYACRLPALEKLQSMKRQGRILALRFITDEYTTPLGVWVVREATRKALSSTPLTFGDAPLLLKYVIQYTQQKFGVNLEQVLNTSKLLKTHQKGLLQFA